MSIKARLFSNAFMRLLPRTLELFLQEKWTLSKFVVLTLLAAMTEGASMALLIPILGSQSTNSRFTDVPVLGPFLGPIEAMDRADALIVLCTILAGVILVRGAVQFGAQSMGVLIPLRLECILTEQAYSALVRSRIGFVESKDYGSIYTHIKDHTQRVSTLLNAIVTVFLNFALVVAYLTVMVAISWKLTLLSIGFIAVLGVAVKLLLIGPLNGIGRDLSFAQASLHSQFLDTLYAMRLILLRAAENLMINNTKRALELYYISDRKRLLIATGQSPLIMTAAGLFICALIIGGAYISEEGDTAWVGVLLVFVMSLYRMLTPAVAISSARATIAGNVHSMEELDTFLKDASAATQSSGDKPYQGLGAGIRVEGVEFSYDGAERAALHDVSFELPPKSMIALVGPSGAGKSSVVGLLTRFYDPQKGRILIDGTDLCELDVRAWRKHISVVAQNTVLFNDTVVNNLTFGLDDVPMERIEAATAFAAADAFIRELPNGYDTVIAERGARLSGGQQQRLAIAQAFLTKPDLLILDEATSHLDSLTEQSVQQAIETFRHDATVLVIAHRLSTIRKADMILVFDHGRIVERGTHNELYKQKGMYRNMLEHQQFELDDDLQNDLAPSGLAE